MTRINLKDILHKRIINKCIPLYIDGYFPEAAFNAMKQVELAFKEKVGIEDKKDLFGSRLYEKYLGPGKSIKLTVPLGDSLQKEARKVFESVSSYYRNYLAHEEGDKIDKIICTRILIIASELLDLVDVSDISYIEIGGIEGLIKQGIFENGLQIYNLLSLLSFQVSPNEVWDDMFEELAKQGYSEKQYEIVFQLGLVKYYSKKINHSGPGELEDWDDFGWIELTPLGKTILEQARKSQGDML